MLYQQLWSGSSQMIYFVNWNNLHRSVVLKTLCPSPTALTCDGVAAELLFPSCFRDIPECISKSSHSCHIRTNAVPLSFCRFNFSLPVLPLVQLQSIQFCPPSLLLEHSDPGHLWKWPGRTGNIENRWWGSRRIEYLRTANHMKWGNNGLRMKITSFPHFILILTLQ